MIGDITIGFGHEPLADHATDHRRSRGRLLVELESPTRTCFQRDRDRIVHSTAFRRLNHKTQVFFSHESDHFRTRLTHTIEVAQIARALARALRLDEDLAEAVALVHDFGHTPFGHTGEDVLDALMAEHGGFDHNVQALRVVTKLEQRYAGFDGLNLTWETLEGLVKHNGPLMNAQTGEGLDGKPVADSLLAYCALHDLELASHAGLEAQVAAIADDIAYNTHDIDDGLRSGLLSIEMLGDVPMVADAITEVDQLHPRLDDARRGHEVTRRIMTAMVEDVITASCQRLEELRIRTADDVRAAGQTLVAFSAAMAPRERALKRFMFERLYRHPAVMRVRHEAEGVVRDLFTHFMARPTDMGTRWADEIAQLDESARALRVSDFIAGMTDSYALRQHQRFFDQTPSLRWQG